MKLGLDSYSTRNSGLDPVGVLELAAGWGLQGVLFELSPFTSFRDEELARIRRAADERGLYCHLGMGSIFSWHPMAAKGRELLRDAGYDVRGPDARLVIHHLDVARKLGSPLLRVVAGNLFTRDEGHDMAALADQAVAILREACKAAEDWGLRIAMENHADFTVRELASILARVNSPAFGFTVDCANHAFDLDDPVRLAEIMAPYALTTHYKNYRIVRTEAGLALENVSLGEGDIDIKAVAQALRRRHPEIALNIEIHSQFAPFRLNILEEGYFRRHPAPPGDGLAWYLAKSWERPIERSPGRNLADGAESWAVERQHLEQSVRWARENLADLA
ncbi:MAG: sugar phosphate isomerase/epimerase [Thermoguttaceae bacterium]|nr:sugar phosphate isomerase/epimerase [Thermoguttaceae bacterium]